MSVEALLKSWKQINSLKKELETERQKRLTAENRLREQIEDIEILEEELQAALQNRKPRITGSRSRTRRRCDIDIHV